MPIFKVLPMIIESIKKHENANSCQYWVEERIINQSILNFMFRDYVNAPGFLGFVLLFDYPLAENLLIYRQLSYLYLILMKSDPIIGDVRIDLDRIKAHFDRADNCLHSFNAFADINPFKEKFVR